MADPERQTRPRERYETGPILVLLVAILAISTSSILVRIAQAEGVHSLAIATWRLVIAALILAPLVVVRHRVQLTEIVRHRTPAAVAGVLLALHFAAWISSLETISVATSTALLTTNPVWVAVLSALFLHERAGRSTWLGVLVASFACMWLYLAVAPADGRQGDGYSGQIMALVGAFSFAGYLLIGRGLRSKTALVPYLFAVTSVAAIALALLSLALSLPLFKLTPLAWACCAGMALAPHLLGHGAMNWAMKHLPATSVAVATLGEPVGAALLAWLILHESVSAAEWVGFTLLLVGIALAVAGGRKG